MYALSRVLARRFPSPLTTPVFFNTAMTIVLLYTTGLEYRDYEPAKNLLVSLLGPATVALAVPIYRNRQTLRMHAVPALCGIALGSLTTILVVVVVAHAFHFSRELTLSMSVKSVTAAIAIELATMLRANPALAAAFVIATGMIGTMLGPWLLTRTGIMHPLARGLALGTTSHGQGTAQALSEGSLEGAIAGIEMGIAAIGTSFLLPWFTSVRHISVCPRIRSQRISAPPFMTLRANCLSNPAKRIALITVLTTAGEATA